MDKPNPEGLQEEGWNVESEKKSAKTTRAKLPRISTKNAPRNKFEALHIEEPEIETPEENEEEAPLQEQEIPAEAPSPKQKDAREENHSRPIVRKEGTANSEGSITRSREKASSEETLENSNEEQEPQSRKM